MLQDVRRRLLLMSPRPAYFETRLQTRRHDLVQRLNQTMGSLWDQNRACHMQEDHEYLARLVEELDLKLHAQRGNYQPICPRRGQLYDPTQHVLANTLTHLNSTDGNLSYILLTTTLGVKFQMPDGRWRACCRAEVVLMPSRSSSARRSDTNICYER